MVMSVCLVTHTNVLCKPHHSNNTQQPKEQFIQQKTCEEIHTPRWTSVGAKDPKIHASMFSSPHKNWKHILIEQPIMKIQQQQHNFWLVTRKKHYQEHHKTLRQKLPKTWYIVHGTAHHIMPYKSTVKYPPKGTNKETRAFVPISRKPKPSL